MNLLRTLLLMLLVCAVPATALGDVLHQGSCPRGLSMDSGAQAVYVGHGEHARHMDHQAAKDATDSGKASANDGCQCGCTCGGIAHCGAGVGVSVASPGAPMLRFVGDSHEQVPESGHALAGHPGDFLRPPSKS